MGSTKKNARPSAKKRALHTASLNKKRQRREDRVLMEDIKLGWPDLLMKWANQNLTRTAASLLRKLVEKGPKAMKISAHPEFVIQELAQKKVIAQSEGFFMVSKVSKLKNIGVLVET